MARIKAVSKIIFHPRQRRCLNQLWCSIVYRHLTKIRWKTQRSMLKMWSAIEKKRSIWDDLVSKWGLFRPSSSQPTALSKYPRRSSNLCPCYRSAWSRWIRSVLLAASEVSSKFLRTWMSKQETWMLPLTTSIQHRSTMARWWLCWLRCATSKRWRLVARSQPDKEISLRQLDKPSPQPRRPMTLMPCNRDSMNSKICEKLRKLLGDRQMQMLAASVQRKSTYANNDLLCCHKKCMENFYHWKIYLTFGVFSCSLSFLDFFAQSNKEFF